MTVGNSIRKSIDDWELAEFESAMLHACNAVDGTAKKTCPNDGNKSRFTRLLRDNYFILGPMGIPGINIEQTRWPIGILKSTTLDKKPDFADVIYGIHRCTHGHGDELPDGFDLISDATGPPGITHLFAQRDRVRLSDRVIFGLLAVAVMSPANHDQRVPDGYHFTFGDQIVLPINEWWGRASDFPAVAARYPMPNVKLDFGDWMDGI